MHAAISTLRSRPRRVRSRIGPDRSVARSAPPVRAAGGVAVPPLRDDRPCGQRRRQAPGERRRAEDRRAVLHRQHARALPQAGWIASQLFFITGADAFAEIATWHRYPEVLDLAMFVVVARPGHELDGLAARLPSLAPRIRRGDTHAPAAHPSIFLLNVTTADVSSTEVRERIQSGASVRGLVPALVEAHIRHHGLYQPVPADQLHGQE